MRWTSRSSLFSRRYYSSDRLFEPGSDSAPDRRKDGPKLICPNCSADTSDLLMRCENCGHLLVERGPAGEAGIGGSTGRSPSGGSAPRSGLPPSEVPRVALPIQASRPDPRLVRTPEPAAGASPWYLKPWPYVAGILAVIVVVAVVLLTGGPGAAYPELVVDGLPTLLDFYTDT